MHIRFLDTSSIIEVVNDYKYLGVWISKNNKKHIKHLEKNGKKSSFMTAKLLKEFGQINGNFLRQTFEMITLSKMKYGGEIGEARESWT